MGRRITRTVTSIVQPGLLVLVAILTSFGAIASNVGQAGAIGQPLRQVDWLSVLQNDPAVTLDPTAYRPPGGNWPYVNVAAPRSTEGSLGGYALIDDVIYGDLDGNGSDEAIVMIDSGGTGGLLGFLLYREGDLAPKLALVFTGYKIGVEIEGGKVVIREPNYIGFEPNCCPSSISRTINALDGDRLVPLVSETEPNDVQEATVWAFYRAVSEREYEDAYAFYSPAFQAANPFNQWKAGYATTQSIEAETSPGATPNEVQILLTARDSTPGGGTATRRFKGTWTLIWSPEQKRWLLDRASIQPL